MPQDERGRKSKRENRCGLAPSGGELVKWHEERGGGRHCSEIIPRLILGLGGSEVVLQKGLQVLKGWPLLGVLLPALHHELMQGRGAVLWAWHPIAALHLLQHLAVVHAWTSENKRVKWVSVSVNEVFPTASNHCLILTALYFYFCNWERISCFVFQLLPSGGATSAPSILISSYSLLTLLKHQPSSHSPVVTRKPLLFLLLFFLPGGFIFNILSLKYSDYLKHFQKLLKVGRILSHGHPCPQPFSQSDDIC